MSEYHSTSVTEMTVSVHVLTVDGSRRMSHRFFEQIPRGNFFDDDNVLMAGASVWGYARTDEGRVIVGTFGGLLTMSRDDARRAAREAFPPPPQGAASATWDAWRKTMYAAEDAAGTAFDALVGDDLPQLYLGG
jgi:hypothetical protein